MVHIEFSNLLKKTPILLILDEFTPCDKGGTVECTCDEKSWNHAIARTWRANYDTGKVVPGTEKVVIKSPYQVLMPRETLVIETPHAPNAEGKDIPYWQCYHPGAAGDPWVTGGTGARVLPLPDDSPFADKVVKDPTGVPMALDQTNIAHGDPLWDGIARLEWNSNTADGAQWLDLSAVDGTNLLMYLQFYEKQGSSYKKTFNKRCIPDIQHCPEKAKDARGQPTGAYACTSPKFWYENGSEKWKMAGCPYGDAPNKERCHTWWKSDKEGALRYKGWLYKGDKCDAYAWAYDEFTCKNEGCAGEKFDKNGNPEIKNPLEPLITPMFSKHAKITFFFDQVMGTEKQEKDESKPIWKRPV
eukprot:g15107.t1